MVESLQTLGKILCANCEFPRISCGRISCGLRADSESFEIMTRCKNAPLKIDNHGGATATNAQHLASPVERAFAVRPKVGYENREYYPKSFRRDTTRTDSPGCSGAPFQARRSSDRGPWAPFYETETSFPYRPHRSPSCARRVLPVVLLVREKERDWIYT